MSTNLKILAALSVIALMAACCKPPTEPIKPSLQAKKIGTVYARVVGILPNDFATPFPLTNIRIEQMGILAGISGTGGSVRLDSLIQGTNTLRLTGISGILLDTSLVLSTLKDSTAIRDTLILRVHLTQENVRFYNFTIPVAVGNEWTYTFTENVNIVGIRSVHLLYTYQGEITYVITKQIQDTSFYDNFPLYRYVGKGIRNMKVTRADDSQIYSVADTIENAISIGYGQSYTTNPLMIRDTIFGFTFTNPFNTNNWKYSISMKPTIDPKSNFIVNDTLSSNSPYGTVFVGYSFVRFVNNIGMVYFDSGTSWLDNKSNSSTYSLKSYKLVKPTFR